jgi:predicted transcriptional regulator
MSVIPLYDSYGSEIRDLFSSAISVKILLLLSEQEYTVAGFCAGTGHVPTAVLPKFRELEECGLADRTDGTYALTTPGRVIASKIVALFNDPGEPCISPADADASSRQERSGLLDRYDASMNAINLVVRSGIRTRMLLTLLDGRTERGRLRELTGCQSSNLRTNIRKLSDSGFLREDGYDFALTPVGGLLALRMKDLVLATAVIAKHRTFWMSHSLEGVPDGSLDTLGALVDTVLIGDDATNAYRNYEHFLDLIAAAGQMHGISPWANPGIADAIGARVVEGIPVELIITPELAFQLQQDPYREKIEALRDFPNFTCHITDLPLPVGLTVTDNCLSFGLFFADDHTYDPIRDLYSTSLEACMWGEELFAWYRRQSVTMEEYLGALDGGG